MAKSHAKMLNRVKKKEDKMKAWNNKNEEDAMILKIHQEYVREMESYGSYIYETHSLSDRACGRCGYSLKYSEWDCYGYCSRGCALSMK